MQGSSSVEINGLHLHGCQPEFRLCVEVTATHDYEVRNHQHCDYELIYLRCGSYKYHHNSVSRELRPGEAALLRPKDWHKDEIGKGTKYVAISFILKNEPRVHLLKKVTPEQLLFKNENNDIDNLINVICNENQFKKIFASSMLNTYVNALFLLLQRKICLHDRGSELAADEEKNFAERFRNMVTSRITAFPLLTDMAREFCITPRSLNNYCRKIFGVSPHRIFMRIKMDKAKEFLRFTDMSVKEISDYLGFRNQYHFSSAFKRIFSYTPKEVRKQGY